MAAIGHRWKFFRAGGVDQVVLRDGADILNLDQLDQKLWLALACPTRGIEFDARTLDLIDTDKDGRIRVPEILAVVKWLKEVFKNPNDLLKGSDSVPLTAINESSQVGSALLAGAKRILANLGKASASAISLSDVTSTEKLFLNTRLNGDGVVPADSAEDEATKKAIEAVISTHGSVMDRCGKPGVNRQIVEKFFGEAALFSDWLAEAERDKAMLPLGEETASAAAAIRAVAAKVDDYFSRCKVVAFDSRAAGPLNRSEAEYADLAKKEITSTVSEIASFPLARVEAGKPLPLADGLNPAWVEAIGALHKAAVKPLLGRDGDSLALTDWIVVKNKMAPYEAWFARKPSTAVEKLGPDRVRSLLKEKAQETILALIDQDAALEKENAQSEQIEKMIRFQRDLFPLLNNFVNFSDFYSRRGAIFQAGTLYLDGRSCNLCVRVNDPGKHAGMAALAKSYLAYCDCVRPNGEKMTIAAAFTDGDSDQLMVGRNGIFYDRKGQDWDATITKVIENPISIRQAFWKPYKSFVRMIEEQVAKRAAAAESSAAQKAEAAATAVATADKMPAGAKPEQKKIDVGTVAALGVAVGGIATFLSSILATFFGLGVWMPLGIAVLVLAISGPSMLIAWLKLRQRNLGPILDANGWAVNGRVKINVPFGGALTSIAVLPRGSERSLRDPYAEKKRRWPIYVALLAALLALAGTWYLGKLDAHLPERIRSTTVLGGHAPAEEVPAPKKVTPPAQPGALPAGAEEK